MSETKGYAPFWVEFLLFLLLTLVMLVLIIYHITKESLLLILFAVMFVPLMLGIFWITIEEFKFRLGRRGFLGFFLLFVVGYFLTEWNWVRLCMVLLGGGLILYDVVSKRALSQAQNGEIANG